jgi:hypothetical protein
MAAATVSSFASIDVGRGRIKEHSRRRQQKHCSRRRDITMPGMGIPTCAALFPLLANGHLKRHNVGILLESGGISQRHK